MRRIVLWLASTVTIVVLLFGYHTSTNKTSRGGHRAAPAARRQPQQPSSLEQHRAAPSPGTSSSSSAASTTTKTYTGSVAQTRWGPVQVQITVPGGKITKVTVLQQPNGNPKDVGDQRLRPADPHPGHPRRPERARSTWSAVRRSPATATCSRCSPRWTRPAYDTAPIDAARPTTASVRRVEHVMGMPISLALRGRHADTAAGGKAWQAVIEQLRDVDRVFSTYRDDSIISRLDRGELTLERLPAEVAEVLDLGREAEQQSGRSVLDRPSRRRGSAAGSTRAESSRDGRRSAPRSSSPNWTTPTSACPPAATSSATPPTLTARPGGSASSTRTTPTR